MDFVNKLPRTTEKHDSIILLVDKITKASHFFLVKSAPRKQTLLKFTCKKLLGCMVYLRQLCLTEIPNSPRTFGKVYSKYLEQI
jgi:hypothetical protein